MAGNVSVCSITDKSVTALAKACTRLRYVDLACCPNLTDLSVLQLAENLPRLKRIGLVRVSNQLAHYAFQTYAPGEADAVDYIFIRSPISPTKPSTASRSAPRSSAFIYHTARTYRSLQSTTSSTSCSVLTTYP